MHLKSGGIDIVSWCLKKIANSVPVCVELLCKEPPTQVDKDKVMTWGRLGGVMINIIAVWLRIFLYAYIPHFHQHPRQYDLYIELSYINLLLLVWC